MKLLRSKLRRGEGGATVRLPAIQYRSRSRKRDLSMDQFLAALRREGFGSVSVFGYTPLPSPCESLHVSIFNAGDRRRDQLAYLRSMFKREKAKRGLA